MLTKKIIKCFILTACCATITICGIIGCRYTKTVGEQNKNKEKIVLTQPTKHVSNVSLLMVGDNLIHSPIYKYGKTENGYDFTHLYENIKSDVEAADIAIINQETIFVENESDYSSYPMFGSPTEIGDAAVEAGFDVFAHATNHTIDKGEKGILETIAYWETKHPDITFLGIHDDQRDSDISYITRNDIKFAFVNYTYGLNGLDSRLKGQEFMIDRLTDLDIETTLKEAEDNAEITVAILHVGTEYVYEPTKYAKEQVERFIDNGADIVLCAHPHVIEPYEVITTESGNSGLVYYSLGNFISAQDEVPRIVGGMAKINVQKTKFLNMEKIEILDYDMVPLITHQSYKTYTTYKLSDYTDQLCNSHTLQRKQKFDCAWLSNFFYGIVGREEKKPLQIYYYNVEIKLKEN